MESVILLAGALVIVAGVVVNWRWAAKLVEREGVLDEREYRLGVRETDLARRESRAAVWAGFNRRDGQSRRT